MKQLWWRLCVGFWAYRTLRKNGAGYLDSLACAEVVADAMEFNEDNKDPREAAETELSYWND